MFARDARYPSSPFVCKYNTLTVQSHTKTTHTLKSAKTIIKCPRSRREATRPLPLPPALPRSFLRADIIIDARRTLPLLLLLFPGKQRREIDLHRIREEGRWQPPPEKDNAKETEIFATKNASRFFSRRHLPCQSLAIRRKPSETSSNPRSTRTSPTSATSRRSRPSRKI